MENETKPEPMAMTPQPMEFVVGRYTVKLKLDGQCIAARAYSELDGKLFEANVQENDIAEYDRNTFGNCEGIYDLIEECLLEKRLVQFSDVGELKFAYSTGTAKKRIERTLDLRLKEVEIGELQRLTMKVGKIQQESEEQKLKIKQL